MKINKVFTRRDFIKGTTVSAAGIALGMPTSLPYMSKNLQTSKVVLIRDEEAVDEKGNYNGPVLEQMLDKAVSTLLAAPDTDTSWKSILDSDDTLGIKTNIWKYLPTPKELEQALKSRALKAGIPESKISIRDRGLLDDPNFVNASALINIRPLRTHHWSGIGGCIKNYITFHREPWTWHDDSCADLGGLWNMPVCKGKTVLNILVALKPQFHGIGPHHFDPELLWHYKGLFVSQDPVALDSLGVKLLEEKRKVHFDRPPRGGTSSKHVAYAETRHNIGVADFNRIELIKIGWKDEILI